MHDSSSTEHEVDRNIVQGIFVMLVLAFQVMALYIITENRASRHYSLLVLLLAITFVLKLINGFVVKEQHRLLRIILPIAQTLLILGVEYFDTTGNAQVIVLILIVSVINGLPLRYAKPYSAGAYVLYSLVIVAESSKLYDLATEKAASYIITNMVVSFLILLAFFTVKTQLITNKRLQIALRTLKEQALQLEEMGALAERSRIAGEIHDTVGHTLTSAIISIEAGEKLFGSNAGLALDKFRLAKAQVKRGLDDIRLSVRTLQNGSNKPFLPQLEHMLNEIHQNTGLYTSSIVNLETQLLPIQQFVLLNAIRECATNSLKHGASTEADLLIQEHKGSIRVTFTDNGRGTEAFRFGFGLQNMADRVRSIGGTLSVVNVKNEGFTVNITVPIGIKKEDSRHV